jgi:hypothetical protein
VTGGLESVDVWDSRAWAHWTASTHVARGDDFLPPTLGVREPREPSPSSLTGGAAAELHFEPDLEAEAVAARPGLT